MKKDIWIKYYENELLKEEITFDEIIKRINLKVAELRYAGIKQGDRVIVQLPNSPISVVAYFAIYRLKAIAVPVSTLEEKIRLDYIISNCRARAIINTKGVKILNKAIDKEKNIKNICTIIYTSGTTGGPKGVCLGWDNWVANAKSLIKHHKLNKRTILASPLLLTHCNAHGLAMIATYLAGCKWILFNKTPPNLLKIISNEKVNILSVVPPILYNLYNTNKNWKPDKELRYILTAAAPLSPDLLSNVIHNWGVKVIQGFGLSESTNFSCTLPVDLNDELYKKIMLPTPSVGTPLAGVKIKVGKNNKEGEIGELLIHSKSNFYGYWGRDKIKRKKWVATGDVGYYKTTNRKKYYYLTGRSKEIINRGGEKISPVELEQSLCKSGLRGEFAIISMPSKKYGEEVGLACCEKLDFSIIKTLPKHIRPKKVFLLNKLFYTHTGKLQRKRISDFCNKNNAKLIMEANNN